ncbi:metallophosphatase family protein [Acetatifactor muris]|uniref:Phosphoesterase n=1 Tax=Acetatifactor muris TaxID=879566 RepID=A0A2K4ZL22_9FIRM|nr:metallophosphoesterase family protein [Acetatifactor muris]MCR2050061.1 metallophosphatase family protein [Acetatifactor muris]SOY31184.1 phosphodiesterase [Acetatifactor muris]
MEEHRIAVISDTHGILRPEAAAVLKSCEVILHAGDFDNAEIWKDLKKIGPVYAVRGNVDKKWADDFPEELPYERELSLYGFRIYMIHNRKQARKDVSGIDMVVFGHSHEYEESKKGEVTYLNPGSCGQKRFHLPLTMMVLTLYPENHQFQTEKIDCNPAVPDVSVEKASTKFLGGFFGKKKSSKENHLDMELTEQICRMYVTHPGVDADGIMDRLERKDL